MYKWKLTRIIYSNIYFCSDLFLHLSFKSLLLMSCCYSKGRRWMNADNYHSRHHYHQQTQQQHQQQFQHQSLATCTFSVIMYHFLKSLHCTLSRAPTLIPLFDSFAQIFNMIILVLIGRLQCEFQLTYNISHCPFFWQNRNGNSKRETFTFLSFE